jgi:hypothetical protein
MRRISAVFVVNAALVSIAPLSWGLMGCGAAPPFQQTTADNAREDDPWLDGPRCTPETPGDVAVRIEDVREGIGKPVEDGARVRVHYVATRPDGVTIHDTRAAGLPLEITIGSTHTICGFERALLGMRAGGQRRVVVPWRLAFGEEGRAPDVGPRADLTFLIDLYLPADVPIPRGGPPPKPAAGGAGGAGGGRRR